MQSIIVRGVGVWAQLPPSQFDTNASWLTLLLLLLLLLHTTHICFYSIIGA
jgi:hypothetical protein